MTTVGENNFRYFKNVNRLFRGSDYDYNLDQLLGIFNGKDGTVYDVQFGNINASSLIASIIGDSSSTVRGDGSQLTGISAAVANISPTSYPDLFIMNALEKAGIIASAPNAMKINNAFVDTSKMTGSVRVSYTTAAGTSILFDHGLDSELEEINDMQTKADWTAGTGTPTIGADATNFLKGTLSIKMSKTVTGGLDMYDTVALSLTDRNLRVSAFPDTLSSVSYLYVILYTSSGNTVEYRFPASGLTAAEWNHLTVDLNSAPDASAGTFVRGTITRIYLGAFTSASQEINVSWATVTAISDKPFLVPGYAQAIVIKDGTNQEVTTVVSEDSGLPGKFTLSAALTNNYTASTGVLTANSGTVSNGQMTHDATGTGVQATKAIKIDTLQTSKTISSASLEAFIRFYHPSIELNTFTSTTQFGAYSATNVAAFYTAGTPIIIYKRLRVNGEYQSMNGTASSNFFYTTLAGNSSYSGTTLSFETTDAIDLGSDTTGYYLIPATVVYKYCAGAKTASTFTQAVPSELIVKSETQKQITDDFNRTNTTAPTINGEWVHTYVAGNAGYAASISSNRLALIADNTNTNKSYYTHNDTIDIRGDGYTEILFQHVAHVDNSANQLTKLYFSFGGAGIDTAQEAYVTDGVSVGLQIAGATNTSTAYVYQNNINCGTLACGTKTSNFNIEFRIFANGGYVEMRTWSLTGTRPNSATVVNINKTLITGKNIIMSVYIGTSNALVQDFFDNLSIKKYSTGYTLKYKASALTNIDKLETAIEINRNDTTNQNPEVYETGTWLY